MGYGSWEKDLPIDFPITHNQLPITCLLANLHHTCYLNLSKFIPGMIT